MKNEIRRQNMNKRFQAHSCTLDVKLIFSKPGTIQNPRSYSVSEDSCPVEDGSQHPMQGRVQTSQDSTLRFESAPFPELLPALTRSWLHLLYSILLSKPKFQLGNTTYSTNVTMPRATLLYVPASHIRCVGALYHISLATR